MPRFHFELEPLLRQRRREEQTRQAELATIERERAQLEQAAQRLQAAAHSARSALRDSLDPESQTNNAQSTRALDPNAARWHATAAGAADARARQLAIKLAGVLKRRGTAQQALAQAAKRRRAVETLREQRLERFNIEQRRKEHAELDDINSGRAAASIQARNHA